MVQRFHPTLRSLPQGAAHRPVVGGLFLLIRVECAATVRIRKQPGRCFAGRCASDLQGRLLQTENRS